MRLESVSQENNGPSLIFLLQQIGVKLRLLPSPGNVRAGPLRLNHSKRTVHIIVKNVIREADSRLVRHSMKLHFIEPVLSLRPACLHQHGVDV